MKGGWSEGRSDLIQAGGERVVVCSMNVNDLILEAVAATEKFSAESDMITSSLSAQEVSWLPCRQGTGSRRRGAGCHSCTRER